ncbi:homeobox protein BEL1 homolog isoform X2 [Musa acuminata AAA Group]|uniref:homeobox protein BEL1 homolog isoform X2 n=1 Tax=Musa acuminata AAA Group TaxID=214697 RepID=UPI0031D882F9
MAHESQYSQFLLGINPLTQSLEHNHDLLGMLEISSRQQTSHFTGDFVHRDLPEPSSRRFLVPAAEMATAASAWPVADGKLCLPLFNVKPSDAFGVLESLQHSVSGDRLQLRAAEQQQPMQEREGLAAPPPPPFYSHNSKYVKPAQELLGELCSVGGEWNSQERSEKASHKKKQEPSSSFPSSSWQQSLCAMNHLELHNLKIKLLSMLEEVGRRYRKYGEQMEGVVSSFESIAGEGSATVYLTLASTAMSKHFKRLKDGIAGQINAVRRAMGEKDPSAPGMTRGETPRLKLLDQCMRQQKALQQGMAQQLPWRPQRGLPEHSVSILRAWLFEHFLHPYPSDVDKIILARQTGLTRSQVSNWFINARVRIWKPMVEDMYAEETMELDDHSNSPTTGHQHSNSQNPKPNSTLERKPLPVQLLDDSESLSSLINSSHHGDQNHSFSSKTLLRQSQQQHQHHQQITGAENFSVVDFDFSSGSYASDNLRSSVSLTLGLQQQSKGGMSSTFSAASQQPLLFARQHAGHGQYVGFSMVDGEEDQPLPYRNLMGIQMLHD